MSRFPTDNSFLGHINKAIIVVWQLEIFGLLLGSVIDSPILNPLLALIGNAEPAAVIQQGRGSRAGCALVAGADGRLAITQCRNAEVPAGLLELAGTLGMPNWQSEEVDIEKLPVSLREEFVLRRSAVMGKVLSESESWPGSLGLTDSWSRTTGTCTSSLAGSFPLPGSAPQLAAWRWSGSERHTATPVQPMGGAAGTVHSLAQGRTQLASEKMLPVAEQVAASQNLEGNGCMRGVAQPTVNAYLRRLLPFWLAINKPIAIVALSGSRKILAG